MAETITWLDADGASTLLEVEWATEDRFAPPVLFDEEVVPEQPGARVRAVRHGVRTFVLPLWITAASEAGLRSTLRSLVAAMDPLRGPGRIRVSAPGGDQREITCFYQDGLNLKEVLGQNSGPLMQRAPVIFRAPDPYFYDISDTLSPDYTIGTPATFFPILPLRLTNSDVFADLTVVNSGDVQAWPVWTLIGPGSAITLRNLTTGKVLTLSVTLGAGESVTIDTRPGAKTVTKNDGSNLFGHLGTSALWPLARGTNQIRMEMAGATTASLLRFARRHAYLTA
jgi:Phage tail protein